VEVAGELTGRALLHLLVTTMIMEQLERAVAHVAGRIGEAPAVAMVLGSGLGALADSFDRRVAIPYAEIPGMVSSGVIGHAGQLVAGRLDDVPVIAMQGRLHPYEGHPLETVVLGARVMLKLGASVLIVTNAAGGMDPGLRGGSVMIIEDHLNLTGKNCLVGPNPSELGPRFPDMSEAYDRQLIALAHTVAARQGLTLAQGVYAGVLGPSYETPAEVRMLRAFGASAVGMSTVQEVIAARHMGARVLGLSCITNLAAGLSPEPLQHADVERTARATAHALAMLVRGIVAEIGGAR
jgi:purine-nucleoside phosphorylase